MKHFLVAFLQKFISAWVDFWLTLPIVFTIYLLWCSYIPFYIFLSILTGTYIFGLILRSLLIKRKRIFTLIISLIWSASMGAVFGSGITNVILIGIIAFIVACRSIVIIEQLGQGFVFPRVYYLISLLTYFITYLIYSRISGLLIYQPFLLIGGLIATVSSLIMVNSDVLMKASRADLKNSTSLPVVKKNNRLITFIMLVVISIIASYSVLMDYTTRALRATFLFLIRLIDIIMNFLTSPVPGGPMPGEEQSPFLPPVEGGSTSPIWDTIIIIFSYLIMAVLAIFIIRFALKLAHKLYLAIVKLIKRLLYDYKQVDGSGGYNDEKESLMDWQSLRHNYATNIKDWIERILKNEPKWSDLTDNRQRIRYLYRHFVLRCISSGYSFKASLTSDETINELADKEQIDTNLHESFKHLYGKARYGDNSIDDSEVEALRKQLK